MARYSGKNVVVMVDNSSASLTALTHVIGVTVNYEFEEVEFRGDSERTALAGQQITRVEVEYEYDDTGTTGNHAVLGGIVGDNTTPRTVAVRPLGTGSGLPVFTMEGLLLSYGAPNVTRENKIVATAVFVHHANATDAPAWSAQ